VATLVASRVRLRSYAEAVRSAAKYRDRLTLAEAAEIMLGAVRDKSYRVSPLGQLVGRYMRWFRNEWGATAETRRDYESVLAKMSLSLAHREPLEVDVEDLRSVIDHYWADASARTRQKVTSVIRSFWAWAEEEAIVPFSPAARLRRPRAPRPVAPLLPANSDARLLAAAEEPRDRVALLCLLDLGLRRGGLTSLQVRNFDLARKTVTVTEKGQKSRVLPLRGRIVMEVEHVMLADLPGVGRAPEPDDYVLYAIKPFGRGKVLRGYPKQPASPQYVHRWWYRQLEAAGLVGAGVRSGLNMHRARHTFAVELRRVAGIDAASQALGHSDLSTTLGIYGHRDLSDLERDMDAFARWKRDEASGIVPANDSDDPLG
jgi:integrase/recombinase XerC